MTDPFTTLNIRSICKGHHEKNRLCRNWIEAHFDFAKAASHAKKDPTYLSVLKLLDTEISLLDLQLTDSGMRN